MNIAQEPDLGRNKVSVFINVHRCISRLTKLTDFLFSINTNAVKIQKTGMEHGKCERTQD